MHQPRKRPTLLKSSIDCVHLGGKRSSNLSCECLLLKRNLSLPLLGCVVIARKRDLSTRVETLIEVVGLDDGARNMKLWNRLVFHLGSRHARAIPASMGENCTQQKMNCFCQNSSTTMRGNFLYSCTTCINNAMEMAMDILESPYPCSGLGIDELALENIAIIKFIQVLNYLKPFNAGDKPQTLSMIPFTTPSHFAKLRCTVLL